MSIELNQSHKPGPSQQDNELWITLATDKYPGISSADARILRDEAVMEWVLDLQTEKAKLYEQYYLVKTIKNA
jgi:hypothetical protein